MSQPTLWEAMERGKAGMQQAVDHADRVVAGWSELAYIAMCVAARSFGAQSFTIEQLRRKVEFELPDPPDRRAWGSVTRRAINAGVIRKTGSYAPRASGNGTPTMTYLAG